MSRIGKKPVKVPSGVTVEVKGQLVKVIGSKATLSWEAHPDIGVEYDASAGEIKCSRSINDRTRRALHGTTRALIANMIEGVTKGYSIGLEVYGTGYGVKHEGKVLILTVGTAQPYKVAVPDGVTIDIKTGNARGNDTPAIFIITGPDKQILGQLGANIRRVRPPEPYLGKGIRYAGEQIKRKAGKAFASGG